MNRHTFDDSRDEALARELDAALPRPPVDDVDWSALHARITSAAQPLFGPAQVQRVQQPVAWWQPLSRWSPRGIPLAAAASVLLVLGVALGGPGGAPGSAALERPGFVMVEEELVNGVSSSARPLLAGLDADAMIDYALFHDGEEW